MESYYLERSGGQWEGRWYSKDEGRYYRRVWKSVRACRDWCKDQDFKFVLVNH